MKQVKRFAVACAVIGATAAISSSPTAIQAQEQSQASTSAASGAKPALDYNVIKVRYAHAHWAYPNSAQMANAYPRQAQDSGITGTAEIACFIQPDGSMQRCVPLAESPEGYRFGTVTAQQFLKYMHVDPATVEGGIQPGDFYVVTYKWLLG